MRARCVLPVLSFLALTVSCATATKPPTATDLAMAAPVGRAARQAAALPACAPGVDFWVFYLDHVGSNYLFRGGMPIVNGQVAYDELVETKLPAAAQAAGQTLPPPPYYVIDVSLVQIANGGNDLANSQTEYNYWAGTKEPGQWHYWQIDGEYIDPNCSMLQPAFQKSLVNASLSWLPDNLDLRVDQLHSWLQNGVPGNTMPVMIYIHCEGGCDRTGELSGAYALKYLHMNWVAMNQMNCADCYGGCQPFGCGNYYAARWYCYWLETQGYQLGCSVTPPSCNNYPQCNGTPPSCPNALTFVP
jgi:hypothetical protein